MVVYQNGGALYQNGALHPAPAGQDAEKGRVGTIAYRILSAHNTSGNDRALKIKFDSMASHDITYVGIVQTARASGMTHFPLPYVLTNCHNSLCAVGGTINEDDHVFGLSAAKKYGGIFVPAHMAVIHQYMRECMAGGGKMILGSDSHTRYGALGTLGIGEGGPELVKQLCGRTYDIAYPDVVAVHLTGKPRPGVGPQDVALALIREVFPAGLVKNKVLEFIGPGVSALSVDYRCGVDVMTTETACLTSIWQTDEKTAEYLALHGRGEEHLALAPGEGAYYDQAIYIDLDKVKPMIALPFHPSNAYTVQAFLENAEDLLAEAEKTALEMMPGGSRLNLRGKIRGRDVYVDQGVVAGCSGGTYENLCAVSQYLKGHSTGNDAFSLSVYPASQPQYIALTRAGAVADMMSVGVSMRSAFCGPCFGAGDVPSNGGLSIRHTTRNFPSREGAKPASGQMAYVALMDARSIAATAKNGGRLTPATEMEISENAYPGYAYDDTVYKNRVYQGYGAPNLGEELVFGPNIADWPPQVALPENLLLQVASAIYDPVTTTDELIPSGEASSYRSNPMRLAEFTLSRKDPAYVGRAKSVLALEKARREALSGSGEMPAEVLLYLRHGGEGISPQNTGIGTLVFALRPGDGSAREQAASCQRVLGGCANIAGEYATKRYRSNVINWGMLPFILPKAEESGIKAGDMVLLPGIRQAVESGEDRMEAQLLRSGEPPRSISLELPGLTKEDRDILLAGCLINYYAQ